MDHNFVLQKKKNRVLQQQREIHTGTRRFNFLRNLFSKKRIYQRENAIKTENNPINFTSYLIENKVKRKSSNQFELKPILR